MMEARFWAKVDRSGGPDACWEWTAARDADGYGQFSVGGAANNRMLRAPRVAYDLSHPDNPLGTRQCLHDCDNPPCCNPVHLHPGTNTENVRERSSRGRTVHGERHGRAKLSDADVSAIRSRYASGARQRALAAIYGVSQAHISEIVRGEQRR
jgi:hypothetical protein